MMTMSIAIDVIKLALQIGAFRNMMPIAQTAIIIGIAVKTMFWYSFKVASVRTSSDFTKADVSCLYSTGKLANLDLLVKNNPSPIIVVKHPQLRWG